MRLLRLALFLIPAACWAAAVPLDVSQVRPGPVAVEARAESVVVRWPDEASRTWQAEFSLDPARPLITSIGVAGKAVLERGRPLYWCSTGKRRGGWDAFFDFPPTHPDGTRSFTGDFRLRSALFLVFSWLRAVVLLPRAFLSWMVARRS